MKVKRTYLNARSLEFLLKTSSGDVRKYRQDGFITFLEAPVPRYPFLNANSMYPLSKAAISDLIEQIGSKLVQSQPIKALDKDAKEADFFENNCQGCHGRTGPGPLLRIGVSLFSQEYFAAVLTGRFSPEAMPNFTYLSQEQLTRLFRYISHADDDRKNKSTSHWSQSFQLPYEIYPKVMVPLFSKACRHCHMSSADEQREFEDFFGSPPIAFFLERTARGYEPPSQSFEQMLLPQNGQCQTNALIERLKARTLEWQGDYSSKVVGMPLTLPPVDPGTIETIRLWIQSGCPKGGKKYCQACSPQ